MINFRFQGTKMKQDFSEEGEREFYRQIDGDIGKAQKLFMNSEKRESIINMLEENRKRYKRMKESYFKQLEYIINLKINYAKKEYYDKFLIGVVTNKTSELGRRIEKHEKFLENFSVNYKRDILEVASSRKDIVVFNPKIFLN